MQEVPFENTSQPVDKGDPGALGTRSVPSGEHLALFTEARRKTFDNNNVALSK